MTINGERVTVAWKGSTRYGVVAGDSYADSLPTGARFVPVTFDDDGTTHNVDSRIVSRVRCAAHTAPSDWTARCTCPSYMTPPEEAGR